MFNEYMYFWVINGNEQPISVFDLFDAYNRSKAYTGETYKEWEMRILSSGFLKRVEA